MREERRRTGEEMRRSQEPEFKGGERTITSDKEFERELTQADEDTPRSWSSQGTGGCVPSLAFVLLSVLVT